MDNQTEIEIRNFILEYVYENNITTIVISHKLKSFNDFNKVYKIENGKIIEIKNDTYENFN